MSVEYPAEVQILTAVNDGSYRLSKPLCKRHAQHVQRAEDVAIYEVEPSEWAPPPECERCLDEDLAASTPVRP